MNNEEIKILLHCKEIENRARGRKWTKDYCRVVDDCGDDDHDVL